MSLLSPDWVKNARPWANCCDQGSEVLWWAKSKVQSLLGQSNRVLTFPPAGTSGERKGWGFYQKKGWRDSSPKEMTTVHYRCPRRSLQWWKQRIPSATMMSRLQPAWLKRMITFHEINAWSHSILAGLLICPTKSQLCRRLTRPQRDKDTEVSEHSATTRVGAVSAKQVHPLRHCGPHALSNNFSKDEALWMRTLSSEIKSRQTNLSAKETSFRVTKHLRFL